MYMLDWCNQDAIPYKLLQTYDEVLSDVKILWTVLGFRFLDIPFARKLNKTNKKTNTHLEQCL